MHKIVPEETWRARYGIINDFEGGLTLPTDEIPEGTTVLKFFLHISKDEQWERLRDRITTPEKQWKFNEGDLKEREFWGAYMQAYSEMISCCSTEEAPWFIIPADHKWMRDLMISQIVVNQMETLRMQFPPPAENLNEIRAKYFSDKKGKDEKPVVSKKNWPTL